VRWKEKRWTHQGLLSRNALAKPGEARVDRLLGEVPRALRHSSQLGGRHAVTAADWEEADEPRLDVVGRVEVEDAAREGEQFDVLGLGRVQLDLRAGERRRQRSSEQ